MPQGMFDRSAITNWMQRDGQGRVLHLPLAGNLKRE
jgi:hypothetical protein